MAMLGAVLGWYYIPALKDSTQTLVYDVFINALAPEHHGLSEWLRGGVLPLWSRTVYGGAPFLANIQHGTLYPGNLPYLFWSTSSALEVVILLHLAIACVSMFGFLRFGLRTSLWAAVLGAICFTVGGSTMQHTVLGNQFQVICLMPLLFLTGHFALERRRLRWTVLTAVAIGLSFLAGHPEQWLYAMLSLAAYGAAWILARERGGVPRRAGQAAVYLGGGVGLFLLLFGWQVWPTLELMSLGYRNGPGFNQQSPLPRQMGVNALLPDFGRVLTGENVAFVGTAALCLVALGLAGRRAGLGWVRLWIAVTAAAGLVMALGPQDGFYRFLYDHVGLVRSFRVPTRYLLLTYFALAVGAALGLDELLATNVGRWRDRIKQGAVALVLLLGGLAFALLLADVTNDGRSTEKWLAAGGVGALVWIAAGFRRVPRAPLALVLIVLTAVELFYARPFAEYREEGPNQLADDYGPTLEALGADQGRYLTIAQAPQTPTQRRSIPVPGPVRADPLKTAYYLAREAPRLAAQPGLNLATDAETVVGRDGGLLPLRTYREFFLSSTGFVGDLNSGVTAVPPSRWNWTALDYLALTWFITSDSVPASEQAVLARHGFTVAGHDGYVLRWRRTPPPLARLVHQVDVIDSPDRRIAALRTYPLLDRAIVEQPVAVSPGDPAADHVTTAVREDAVTVRTASPAAALLVLADPWYPGWQVTVDGRASNVLRVDHAFRGVVLPPGRHTVEFHYVDQRFRVGVGIAGLTLLGLLVVTLLGRRRAWFAAAIKRRVAVRHGRPEPDAAPSTSAHPASTASTVAQSARSARSARSAESAESADRSAGRERRRP
jgi:hypothetical protein